MPVPLTQSGQSEAESVRAWEAFLASRAELSGRMQLDACDGCDGCGLRCVAGFGVTREEWEGVKAYLATLPAEEVARVASQEKTVPWPGAEETGATTTYCRYRDLEKNNCFVYPARPTICRLFGHTDWLPCPIEKVKLFPKERASSGTAIGNLREKLGRGGRRKMQGRWRMKTDVPLAGCCDFSSHVIIALAWMFDGVVRGTKQEAISSEGQSVWRRICLQRRLEVNRRAGVWSCRSGQNQRFQESSILVASHGGVGVPNARKTLYGVG